MNAMRLVWTSAHSALTRDFRELAEDMNAMKLTWNSAHSALTEDFRELMERFKEATPLQLASQLDELRKDLTVEVQDRTRAVNAFSAEMLKLDTLLKQGGTLTGSQLEDGKLRKHNVQSDHALAQDASDPTPEDLQSTASQQLASPPRSPLMMQRRSIQQPEDRARMQQPEDRSRKVIHTLNTCLVPKTSGLRASRSVSPMPARFSASPMPTSAHGALRAVGRSTNSYQRVFPTR